MALVTGGTTGIGGITAMAFVREGATVVVADVNESRGEEAVQLIRNHGGEALFVRADASRRADWDRLVRVTVQRHGRLDVLVNSAGTNRVLMPPADDPEETSGKVPLARLKGLWLGMRAVIPQMLRQGAGTVVNTASILGVPGAAPAAAYTFSGHGVLGLAKVAAPECSNPADTDKCAVARYQTAAMAEGDPALSPEAANKKAAKLQPVGRMATRSRWRARCYSWPVTRARFHAGEIHLVYGA